MREFEHLLPILEPPPGGLQRLQQAINAESRFAPARGWTWATALAIPALLLAVWVPQYLARQHATDVLSTALRQALDNPAPVGGIQVDRGAAIKLPSGQAGVRLYLVQTAPPASGSGL